MRTMLVASYEHRIIWLQNEITPGMPRRLEAILKRMNRDDVSPVTFYIACSGGDLLAAMRMIQLVDASESPIIFVGYNAVASAGFLLMQSGRAAYALPRTALKFHRSQDVYAMAKLVQMNFSREAYLKKYDEMMQSDALVLHYFLRRGDSRQVPQLFEQEAQISVAHAKRVGLLSDAYAIADFKADRLIIRKLRAKCRERARGRGIKIFMPRPSR